MTGRITITGFEYVGPREGYVGDVWAVWCNDRGRVRIWLYTPNPERFTVGETCQI